jgi:ribonuclease BN (tRNA processing enzyme)
VTPQAASTVTVLGSSSSTPRPGRACSCYLVRAGDTAIALDLGTGSLSNLRRYLAPEQMSAVIISHMHPDHFLDLIPMRYALRYGPRAHSRRVALYLPPGGDALLRRMTDVFSEEPPVDFLAVYDVRTYDPDAALEIGPVRVRFAAATHFVPTYAIRCDVDGASVTYSADTALDPRVAALADATDVFVCEATLLPDESGACRRGHMSARDAGELGSMARTRRLVLSHYNTETNPMRLLSEARSAFGGDILVADDHLVLELPAAPAGP